MPKPNIRVRVLPRLIAKNGEAATIAVGSVQTVSNGSGAAVVNVGTPGAAVLNFQIPEGERGPQGDVTAELQSLRDDAIAYSAIANASASEADAARLLAEAARDAAFGDADVYADTAAGLAATTEGDQFQVVVDDEIIRYRHDAGPAATEVARMALALGLVKKGPDAVAQIGADMLGAVGLEWNPRTGLSLPGATASQVRDVLFLLGH